MKMTHILVVSLMVLAAFGAQTKTQEAMLSLQYDGEQPGPYDDGEWYTVGGYSYDGYDFYDGEYDGEDQFGRIFREIEEHYYGYLELVDAFANDQDLSEEITQLFDGHDYDHSGFIDTDPEFEDFVEEVSAQIGMPLPETPEEKQEIHAFVDSNGDGVVSLQEAQVAIRAAILYTAAHHGRQIGSLYAFMEELMQSMQEQYQEQPAFLQTQQFKKMVLISNQVKQDSYNNVEQDINDLTMAIQQLSGHVQYNIESIHSFVEVGSHSEQFSVAVQGVFNQFDDDNSGEIEADEFQQVSAFLTEQYGLPELDGEDAEYIYEKFDYNQSGGFDISEFQVTARAVLLTAIAHKAVEVGYIEHHLEFLQHQLEMLMMEAAEQQQYEEEQYFVGGDDSIPPPPPPSEQYGTSPPPPPPPPQGPQQQ